MRMVPLGRCSEWCYEGDVVRMVPLGRCSENGAIRAML